MNEFKKLKKAMNDYHSRNEYLMKEALKARNDEEYLKRQNRCLAIAECMSILEKVK